MRVDMNRHVWREGGRGGGGGGEGGEGRGGGCMKAVAGMAIQRRPSAVKRNFFCALLFLFPLIARLL